MTHQGHTAFHLNPRFYQQAVVRNTERGGWGREERHGPFPFRHSQPFEVSVHVESDRYVVSLNGHHAFDYNHRVPVNEVNRLSVNGEIECHAIRVHGVRDVLPQPY